MMRNLSLWTVLLLLATVIVVLWGPLSRPAVAETGITLGFAVDGSGLVSSAELSKELGLYLEDHLSIPVRVRNFTTQAHLYDWLTRYLEVDAAWLSKDFLNNVPDGEFYQLARNLDHFPGIHHGSIVARQGLDTSLGGQLVKVFDEMHKNDAGKALLAKLEVSRFVSSLRWQTAGWSEDEVETSVAVPVMISATPTGSPAAADEAVEPPQQAGIPLAVVVDPDADAQSQEPLPYIQPIVVQNDQPAEEKISEPAEETEQDADDSDLSPKTPQSKEQIALVADSLVYNSEDDSYEAKGDVVLQQAGVELKSDTLFWQAATQDAVAEGDVFLKDADAEVSGKAIQYNMSTGQGQVREGKVLIREDNFHLSGEQVEKLGQADYFVKDGSFTTCDGEIPDWKFTASEVDVTLGGYAKAKNVWFHVKDVPVLYSPYLMFPVKTERESGLLAPMFGYSNNKGTRASMAWYQVIDRHMDATVYLDYLSEIGLGKGLEYRYTLPGSNNGEALYYHVTGFNETPDLYYLDWKHSGNLPAGWRFLADVEYANDKFLFDEFGETAEQYNQDETVSSLMLQRNWQKLNLVGYARYLKDLNKSNDTTLQRLPEAGLGLARYRLNDTPFYVGLESYATNFTRRDGEDGERLFLRPSLSATFKPGSWLELTPEVAFYERLYNVDDADEESGVPEFSITAATRFLRTFELDKWGVDRLQHAVEPKVTYVYVPDEEQADLPLFDIFDRINERNEVFYSLVNRLTARSTLDDGSKSYREVFNLRLSQSYNIDEARNNTSGEDQPFSDLEFDMVLRPNSYLSLTADGLIPVYGKNGFNRLSSGATVSDETGNVLGLSYAYRDEEFAGTSTDYLRVRMATPLLKPLYVQAEERYDFVKGRELEKVIGLEYRAKCWSLLLTYRERYRDDDEDDQEIGITFVLSGLGETPGFGGGFGALD